MYDAPPECGDCMPSLTDENKAVYEIMKRCYNVGNNIDSTTILRMMDFFDIDRDDQLYCFDLITKAVGKITEHARTKLKNEGGKNAQSGNRIRNTKSKTR